MRQIGRILATVCIAAALVAPGLAASPAGAASGTDFPCNPGWSVSTPYSGFGVVGADGQATCLNVTDFGGVYMYVTIWHLDSPGHYSDRGTKIVDVPCNNVSGFSVCAGPQIHAQTAVLPPLGQYHAELVVVGDYTSKAPGQPILDKNSATFCNQHC